MDTTVSSAKMPHLRFIVDGMSGDNMDPLLRFLKPWESLRRACTAALKWLYTPDTLPETMPDISLCISLSNFYNGVSVDEEALFLNDGPQTHTIVYTLDFLNFLMEEGDHEEFVGILVHEVSLCMVNSCPQGLMTGLADYVRLREGLAPEHWELEVDGRWSQGYASTAYFLDFLEKNMGEGTVPRINKWFKDNQLEWDQWAFFDDVFGQIIGANVFDMWDEYRDSLGDYTDSDEETETQSNHAADESDDVEHDVSSPAYPIPKFHLVIKDLTHRGAHIFQQTVNATLALREAVLYNLIHLYTPETVPRDVKRITLILRSMDGVAYTIGGEKNKEIHFSLDYIESQEYRAREEITGVLVHEVAHCYQYGLHVAPPGLTEGIADFVRLRAGHAPNHWRKSADGQWDAGYDATAYFLDWIEKEHGQGMIRQLNAKLKTAPFSADVFQDLTNCSVDDLWREYGLRLQKEQTPEMTAVAEVQVDG